METVNPSSNATANKSNDNERSANVTFIVRVVGNNRNTTPFTSVPASKARSRNELWDQVIPKVPIVMDERFPGTEQQISNPTAGASPPIYLPQETSTNKSHHRMLHTRWIVMDWDTPVEFSRWYTRNVDQGAAETLKIEIHFNNNLIDFQAYWGHYEWLVNVGIGMATMEKKELLEYHLVGAMGDKRLIKVVPGTNDWFPEREPIDYLAANGGCPICKVMAEKLGLTGSKKSKKKAERVVEAPAEASEAGDGDVEMEDIVGDEWEQDIVMR